MFYYLHIISWPFLPRFLSPALKSTIERSCPFPVLLACFAQTRETIFRSNNRIALSKYKEFYFYFTRNSNVVCRMDINKHDEQTDLTVASLITPTQYNNNSGFVEIKPTVFG